MYSVLCSRELHIYDGNENDDYIPCPGRVQDSKFSNAGTTGLIPTDYVFLATVPNYSMCVFKLVVQNFP